MKFNIEVAGGRIVPDVEYPWAVAVGRKETDGEQFSPYDGYFGGGVAVASRWVLSAAHCFQKLGGFDAEGRLSLVGKPTTLRVTLDKALSNDPQAPVDERIIDLLIRHPGFAFDRALNDLVLLRLTSPCQETAALWTAAYPSEGVRATVWGWGETTLGGRPANTLYEAPVIVRSKEVCAAQEFIGHENCHFIGDPSTMICAGGDTAEGVERQFGTCPGDSGGGLVARDGDVRLLGIASWTDRSCGEATGTPDIYVFVPAYAEWIADTIAANS